MYEARFQKPLGGDRVEMSTARAPHDNKLTDLPTSHQLYTTPRSTVATELVPRVRNIL
jgi:hypothetical protein